MKVGDYVRLDRCQGINRIEEFDEDIKKFKLEEVIGDEWGDETFILDENDVLISSPNIIDLIEVGDYVNGNVVKKLNEELVIMNIGLIYDNNLYLPINKIDIKRIVTKEQFEAMQYNLESQV